MFASFRRSLVLIGIAKETLTVLRITSFLCTKFVISLWQLFDMFLTTLTFMLQCQLANYNEGIVRGGVVKLHVRARDSSCHSFGHWLVNGNGTHLRVVKKMSNSCRKLIKIMYRNFLAQWWEQSPPTNVARVPFPVPVSYVGWVCCWFSSLLRGFFSGYSGFSPSIKTNISKFQFDLDVGPY